MSKDFKTGFLIGAVVTLIIVIILSTMTDLYGRDFNIVAFPRGMILMWSGSVTEIPRGWALCDGTNGTPDLRGRFVLGTSSEQVTGSTGGENSQTLNLDAMRLISGGRIPQWASSVSGGLTQPAASLTSTVSGMISTIPPFYSLAYIMKIYFFCFILKI